MRNTRSNSKNKNKQKEEQSGEESEEAEKSEKHSRKRDDSNPRRETNRKTEEGIEKILKIVREIKDEKIGKNEIKKIVTEVVKEEIGGLRQEMEEMKQALAEIISNRNTNKQMAPKSYVETVKNKRADNILIVKPKNAQESEATKNIVRNTVKIKQLPIGVSRMTKGNKGSIVVGCESGKEIKQLKTSMEATIGENFEVFIPKERRPKLKIIGITREELQLDDQGILDTITVQNELNVNEGNAQLKIIKRGKMANKGVNKNGTREEDGTLIIETDRENHKKLLEKGKVNIGWKKCKVYDFVSVLRCYNCWGYNHMAKHCKKEETCQHCAGKHNGRNCQTATKRCINCSEIIKVYNNNSINDNHEATDKECPTYIRKMEEERRRRSQDE